MSDVVPAKRSIYLDHNATTPVAPEVIEAMLHALRDGWGNPGSAHAYGQRARSLVDTAREQVAQLIGARPDEILFVSGGTEADDLAIMGAAHGMAPGTVITSAIEHPAVLEAVSALAERGFTAQHLPAGPDGQVILPEALPGDTCLVSLMLANNETGVLQPVRALAERAHAVGAPIHTDAAQAVGKIDVDVDALAVDLLSIAGHKLYAPKGIGALYVRRKTALAARLRGGGQQNGLRGGTEPVPGIVGLGVAASLAQGLLSRESRRQELLRDLLIERLCAEIPGLAVTGAGTSRLPNTVHVRFPGVLGRLVLAEAGHIAASTGSACHAGIDHPSPVLQAMGIAPIDALGAVRLSLGRGTTEEDIHEAVDVLSSACRKAAGGQG